jgi:hypothetical protein
VDGAGDSAGDTGDALPCYLYEEAACVMGDADTLSEEEVATFPYWMQDTRMAWLHLQQPGYQVEALGTGDDDLPEFHHYYFP